MPRIFPARQRRFLRLAGSLAGTQVRLWRRSFDAKAPHKVAGSAADVVPHAVGEPAPAQPSNREGCNGTGSWQFGHATIGRNLDITHRARGRGLGFAR